MLGLNLLPVPRGVFSSRFLVRGGFFWEPWLWAGSRRKTLPRHLSQWSSRKVKGKGQSWSPEYLPAFRDQISDYCLTRRPPDLTVSKTHSMSSPQRTPLLVYPVHASLSPTGICTKDQLYLATQSNVGTQTESWFWKNQTKPKQLSPLPNIQKAISLRILRELWIWTGSRDIMGLLLFSLAWLYSKKFSFLADMCCRI